MSDWLLALLPDYGLWILALATYLSCLAVPMPASLLMLAAGGFGHLDLLAGGCSTVGRRLIDKKLHRIQVCIDSFLAARDYRPDQNALGRHLIPHTGTHLPTNLVIGSERPIVGFEINAL